MRSIRRPPVTLLALAAATFVIAAAIGGWYGRNIASDSPALAEPDGKAPPAADVTLETAPPSGVEPTEGPEGPYGGVGQENPPPPEVTPEPGATPDTALAWWYVPYLNADRMRPVEVQSINGITFGPGLHGSEVACDGKLAWQPVPVTDIADGRVSIRTAAFPATGELLEPDPTFDGPLFCDGDPVAAGARLDFEPGASEALLGGWMSIYRVVTEDPVVSLAIPTARWSSGMIGGYPAAVAEPILPDIGLGDSAVLIYAEGVLTKVQANGLPMAMVLQVAEEVVR